MNDSDLLRRLRDGNNAYNLNTCEEAADRIEALVAQLMERDLVLIGINRALRERIRELETK